MTEILTTQRGFEDVLRRLYLEPMRDELNRTLIPIPSHIAFHEPDERRREWQQLREQVHEH